VVNQGARACEKWENEREFIDSARLQGWIGAPDFPSEWAGTGLASLKRKQRVFENAIHQCPSLALLVANGFLGVVCILDGDRFGAVEVRNQRQRNSQSERPLSGAYSADQ
jgi:hypothetical protein